MFKFKPITWVFYFLLATSCSDSSQKNEVQTSSYFDIKGYFEGEVAKLNKEKPLVYKEVYKDEQKAAKEITIKDWRKELSLFLESDINKPSWQNSYSSENLDDTIVYTATTGDLRTKEIKIIKKANKVLSISIENSVSNELYQSNEELLYFPDSLYRIVKKQRVRILGENKYEIVGKIQMAN